uniref:Uncharacterized protein n=1 Tax=Tanacetum cinerariifolium TaxID=118510 RepID=A0A6L2MZQ3_TANCI|nr:hypothetical protein [Tanacetum cinerariifolium]
MDTTIDQQVAMHAALVPHAQRLRIGRSNFRLLSDIKSKESTLHSAAIRTLTDVNINKLHQPWRSFAAIINKCLTGKSSGYDSLRLSQAQILWGLYHKRNVIIHHFMSKDPSIPKRNKFGALLPIELTNEEIRNFNAYKEYYAIATGAAPPKPKASVRKTRSSSETTITPLTDVVGPRLTTYAKGKQAANASKAKSLSALSEVAMTEAQQLKLVTKKSLHQTHISQASSSGADEETGSIPWVLDVPTDEFEEELSWNSTKDEGDDKGKGGDGDDDDNGDGDEEDDGDDGEEGNGDDDDDEDDDGKEGNDDDDDDQEVEMDDEKDDEEEGGDDEQEYDEEEYDEETRDEESFDPISKTAKNSNDEGNGEENLGLNVGREEGHVEEEEEDELYIDININQGRGIQATLEVKDSHVTLTLVNPDGQQQSSSVSSQFMTSMLNLTLDVAQRENDEFLKTADENMQKIIKDQVKEQVKVQVSKILPSIEQTVNEQLKAKVLTRSSHLLNTSCVVAVNLSEMELKKILIKKDEDPSAGPDWGSKRRREGNEPESASALTETATRSAGRSTQGTKSRQASASEFAFAEEPMQTTFQMEEPSHPKFDTGAKDQPIVQSSQHPEWFSHQQKPPSLDSDWNKTVPATHESIQLWISELAKLSDSRSSFNELMDTPLDFSNFPINWLKVDTLTLELLVGPTYELMKGSCKSLVELEYHLEEVFKATTDQLDWVNPEGQPYPHNLLKPLPLIPNNRGRRVIIFKHFINNDLEYLRGGALSRKYTTFITKTKAAYYRHIKWIEDLVPRTMWIEEPIGYDSGSLLLRAKIIAVTELKILEWHNYKHLDWITVRRDNDLLYKFKEGDFKRLRIQVIEDMLLLLVQGKLTNLTVEEHFALNVSLRMFTRSIIIQRRVEDLQLDAVFTTIIWRKSDEDRAAAMIQLLISGYNQEDHEEVREVCWRKAVRERL